MNIIHVADIHYRSDILGEIDKCTDYVIQTAQKALPDAVVIAGDLFDERQAYDSPAFASAVRFVRSLSEIAPVLIVKGTYSHDGSTLKFFENERVLVSEAPEQVALTRKGFIRLDGPIPEDTLALFSCLPSVSKANVIAHFNGSLQENSLSTTELLRDILRSWGEVNGSIKAKGIPAILAGHLTVAGSTLSTGQQIVGRDLELGIGDLMMANCDLVCLGHIHRAQSWNEVFYSGSITRLNFGEEEEKGFWVHTLDGKRLESSFVNTPARVMLTIDLADTPRLDALPEAIPDGAIVRLRYRVSEEDVHGVDEKALKEKLLSYGASETKIEKAIVPKQRIRAAGIARLTSIEKKLKRWAEAAGIEVPPGVYNKLKQLEDDESTEPRQFENSVA